MITENQAYFGNSATTTAPHTSKSQIGLKISNLSLICSQYWTFDFSQTSLQLQLFK